MHPVLLFLHMGAPSSIDEVEEYVYRFLSDVKEHLGVSGPRAEEIIRRIAEAEVEKARPRYEAIGGSPFQRYLREIASAAASMLGAEYRLAMCYAHPLVEEVDPGPALAVPLYPVYSEATTGRCLARLEARWGSRPHLREWWRNRSFQEWVLRGAARGLSESGYRSPHLVFTLHSIPERLVEEGDPYAESYGELAGLVASRLGVDYTLAYQSAHGRHGWLGPSLREVMERLASRGIRELVVYPLGFIAENMETLYELDIEYREAAERLGIDYYRARIDHRDPLLARAIAEEAGKILKTGACPECSPGLARG